MIGNPAEVVEYGHGDTLAYRASLDRLRSLVPYGDVTISTTLPRGGLQVAQPRRTDVNRMRLYVREQQARDVVAWDAMACGRTCRLSDFERDAARASRTLAATFRDQFLRPFGFFHYAAAQLAEPVLEGFPGVLQLFRSEEAGDFSNAETATLGAVARQFDAAIAAIRRRRRNGQVGVPLAHRLECRQMAFAPGRRLVFPERRPGELSTELFDRIADDAEHRLAQHARGAAGRSLRRRSGKAGAASTTRSSPIAGGGHRLLLADSSGDHWVFRLTLFEEFPALTGGRRVPVVMVSLLPECESWGELRPSDFEADEELSRLVPALHYMLQNYAGGSTLSQIARTVHLSPFHFHRRFTELLGITPKHYLYDCQVLEAKRLLARGGIELAQVAAKTGFAHQSHFTSRFKQATGLTPTKWRRLVGQLGAEGDGNPRRRGS